MVRFGAACPAVELLPTDRMNRILGLARPARRGRPATCTPRSTAGRNFAGRSPCAARCRAALWTSGDIVVTSGCTESLSLALQVTTKPGDLVAVESPTYFGILQILEVLGLHALEIPTHPETGISLDALEFALRHDPVSAVVVMTNFSNPLGSSMPDAAKRAWWRCWPRRRYHSSRTTLTVSSTSAAAGPPCAKCYDEQGLVLLCSSFSKDIAPTYRVGLDRSLAGT